MKHRKLKDQRCKYSRLLKKQRLNKNHRNLIRLRVDSRTMCHSRIFNESLLKDHRKLSLLRVDLRMMRPRQIFGESPKRDQPKDFARGSIKRFLPGPNPIRERTKLIDRIQPAINYRAVRCNPTRRANRLRFNELWIYRWRRFAGPVQMRLSQRQIWNCHHHPTLPPMMCRMPALSQSNAMLPQTRRRRLK